MKPKTHMPKVTLVGAGPGDPELLTIKALKAIQKATVLLVDDLGYGELGFQGNPEIPTPHMDSIANAGVRLDWPGQGMSKTDFQSRRWSPTHWRHTVTSFTKGLTDDR